MDTEQKKQAALNLLADIAHPARRAQALDMLTDDAAWWVAGIGSLDKAQLAGALDAIEARKKAPLEFRPVGITAEGDRVAIEGEAIAEMVDGKRYHNHAHILVVFAGERVCQVKEYYDTQHAAETFA